MKVRFGSFVFDSGTRVLLEASGPRTPSRPRTPVPGLQPASRTPHPVHLSPKAFDVLEILLARRPNVVNKDVLMQEIWGGKVVEEANLAIVIGEIRKAVGDDSKSPAIIVTVPRRGYRFAAEAQDVDAERASPADQFVPCWLTWNEKTLPLREGENLVGRHPACAVWINASSVSRTHARIVARAGKVVIEDRGSRNGTFVDGRKIDAPHVLADGSTITFGSESTIFRQWSDEAADGTEPVGRK